MCLALSAVCTVVLLLPGFWVLSSSASASGVTELPLPHKTGQAHGITRYNDGTLLITEGPGRICTLDEDWDFWETDEYSQCSGIPVNIASGRWDGAVFTESDRDMVGMLFTGCTIHLEEISVPRPGSEPWGITVCEDGDTWFTERSADRIGCISGTDRQTIAEFKVPTANSEPWGIVQGPERAIWFTEHSSNKIGRMNIDSKAFSEFPIPTADSGPAGIVVGADQCVWFAENHSGKIGRCSASGGIREFKLPSASSGPYMLAAGPDGNVWFTEREADRVGFCTPSGLIREFALSPGSRPAGIVAGFDGAMWFVEQGRDCVGRIPVALADWYLAEGSTAWGFSTSITIENPNAAAVRARVAYQTSVGPVDGPTIYLPAMSQTTINPADTLGRCDFSTRVTCIDPTKTIAVDRTMTWTGRGASSEEGHCSVGVTSPSAQWYFAEGSSAWGFECWLSVQNPTADAAECTLTYMLEEEAPIVVVKEVPGNSRKSFFIADDIGSRNAAIKVESETPLIAEREMYRNDRREGHGSVGTTRLSYYQYLAEGTTVSGFTTYLLFSNPSDWGVHVYVTFMRYSGEPVRIELDIPRYSRKTLRVNDVLPETDFSTLAMGGAFCIRQPIVVERAMYWDGGTGEACHCSGGMPAAHNTFLFPDGQTSKGRETWTLVQNPGEKPVKVRVSYLKPGGGAPQYLIDTVGPGSRRTYNMEDVVRSGRASVMVQCLTPGGKVAAERSMYWGGRGAGTCTIGGFTD